MVEESNYEVITQCMQSCESDSKVRPVFVLDSVTILILCSLAVPLHFSLSTKARTLLHEIRGGPRY